MGVKKPTKATVRKQLKDTALAAIASLDSAWAADAPMERLRDGAEALKALAEVLGQIESAEKLAETAEALRKRVSGLEKESRAEEAQEEEARAGVIEIARVLEEAGRSVYLCTLSGGRSLAETLNATLQARRPDAVVAFEPSALEQAAQLAQGQEKPPLVYGTGATGTIASYLERSSITLSAAQNEFAAGYLAVEAAVRSARGQDQAAIAPLDFSLIRQENMYDPDNQKLLFPVTR